MSKIPWRRWNRAIHRDVGYLCVGLVIIYSISGIAVNHIHQWNPNYSFERIVSNIGAVEVGDEVDDTEVRGLLRKLDLEEEFKTTFRPAPDQLKIFQENNTIQVNLRSGRVVQERVTERFLIHETNFLHLNHPKKAWTWVADAFAVCLCFLAISGLFILKGKKGITGRGAWLTTAGFLIPLFFLWLYK